MPKDEHNLIPKQGVRASILLVLCACLVACGFQLRGDYQVSAQLQQLALSGQADTEVSQRVEETLVQRGITLVEPAPGITVVTLGEDRLDRRILSLFSSGQVAEYELIYVLPVTITTQNGDVYFHEIQILRDYQDDPDFALAKFRELELLVNEMRQDAARRLLLLLNRITWE